MKNYIAGFMMSAKCQLIFILFLFGWVQGGESNVTRETSLESIEKLGFNAEQLLYIIKLGIKKDAKIKSKDAEIKLKNDEIEKYKPMADWFKKKECCSRFGRNMEEIENNYIMKLRFVHKYHMYNETFLSFIERFNKRHTRAPGKQIRQLFLNPENRYLPKRTLTRVQRHTILITWFVKLDRNDTELKILKKEDEVMHDYRELIYDTFKLKKGAVKNDMPETIAIAMRYVYDVVSGAYEQVEYAATKQEVVAAITAIVLFKNTSQAYCSEVILKSKFDPPI